MLVTLPLRSHRDILLARQKARQIAVLFHFQPQDQVCIAAGAFAVAAQALRHSRSAELRIQIDNTALHVFARVKGSAHLARKKNQALRSACSLRLVKTLPTSGPEFAVEDLAWLVGQLSRGAPHRIFEEIDQQNQEVLALLHALQSARTKIEQLEGKQLTPFAA
jgi:hypothetical protein